MTCRIRTKFAQHLVNNYLFVVCKLSLDCGNVFCMCVAVSEALKGRGIQWKTVKLDIHIHIVNDRFFFKLTFRQCYSYAFQIEFCYISHD
jgi:hypothetical protein